jgi:hypothetical protein
MGRTTARPGAPGSVDRQTRRALTAASYRRKRGGWGAPIPGGRKPGLLLTRNGRAIVLATTRLTYGASTHTSAQLVHLTDELLLAYQGGQVVGALAIWKCLASTATFQLTANLTGRLCPGCLTATLREATTLTGLTGRNIRHLRTIRDEACQRPGCPPEAAAVELAAAARAAAPDLDDSHIAARLLQLTAQTAQEDTVGAWLIALAAAMVAGPALDEEPAHV